MNAKTLKTLAFGLLGSTAMMLSTQAMAQQQPQDFQQQQMTQAPQQSQDSQDGGGSTGTVTTERRAEIPLFVTEKTPSPNANWQKVRFRKETRIPENSAFTPYHDNMKCEAACPHHDGHTNVRSVVVINGFRF